MKQAKVKHLTITKKRINYKNENSKARTPHWPFKNCGNLSLFKLTHRIWVMKTVLKLDPKNN